MRVAVVFPGQGSQGVGMGVDVARESPAAARLFERAAEVLGYDLLALQREGPQEKLRETCYSQPAIFATNVALYEAAGESLAPMVSAGHSFGELCSLVAARSISFEDALRVVDERAKAMQFAASQEAGGMAAVLGLEADEVRRIAQEVRSSTGATVQLANFNAPTQIVISGTLQAVRTASEAMLAGGAKRVVELNVSGAWHSVLMEPAVERYERAVENATFQIPAFDVISNVDAQPYRDVAAIRRNLVRSIVHEVRWHETAEKLLSYEVDLVVECGASAVLGPLMKRMKGAAPVMLASDYASVQKLRAMVESSQVRV